MAMKSQEMQFEAQKHQQEMIQDQQKFEQDLQQKEKMNATQIVLAHEKARNNRVEN